jgi:two-component sensor histidine kinase
MLVWVPLVVLGIELMLGGTRAFGARVVCSGTIAETVCVLCYGAALTVHHLVIRFMKWRGGAAFDFGLSMLLMPCALPVGLFVGAWASGLVGRPFTPNANDYRYGIGFGIVIMALFFLHRARAEAKDRVRELENAHLRAQLAALSAEMNPHMLFNALNTIASLVHDDPERAERTVLELAEVYRGILRASSGVTHALADELRLCEAYLGVERARYGERLRVLIEVDPGVDTHAMIVPVLILQPLVENAVKHGIAPRAEGGTITVRVRRDGDAIAMVVEDDGVGLGAAEAAVSRGNRRALSNCAQRLELVYGGVAAFDIATREAGGTRAQLVLPVAVPP